MEINEIFISDWTEAEQSQQASPAGLLPAQVQDRCHALHPCCGFNAPATAGFSTEALQHKPLETLDADKFYYEINANIPDESRFVAVGLDCRLAACMLGLYYPKEAPAKDCLMSFALIRRLLVIPLVGLYCMLHPDTQQYFRGWHFLLSFVGKGKR